MRYCRLRRWRGGLTLYQDIQLSYTIIRHSLSVKNIKLMDRRSQNLRRINRCPWHLSLYSWELVDLCVFDTPRCNLM